MASPTPQPEQNKPKVRGLRDIRTSTGPATSEANLPQIYMRLCALEMERHRREHERQSAVTRARRCEERCAEIDLEREKLLQAMSRLTRARDESEQAQPSVTRPAVPSPKAAAFIESAPRRLTHRY